MKPEIAEINLNSVYLPSEKIVSRKIEGEILIIPIEDGLANLNDAMFSLNGTGLAIWEKLNSDSDVATICNNLAADFNSSIDQIRVDVIGFLNILLEKQLIIEYRKG
jgi:hypothetical protein